MLKDEDVIAFHDRSPGASVHILVIPREHVTTVKALDNGHVPLCKSWIIIAWRNLFF